MLPCGIGIALMVHLGQASLTEQNAIFFFRETIRLVSRALHEEEESPHSEEERLRRIIRSKIKMCFGSGNFLNFGVLCLLSLHHCLLKSPCLSRHRLLSLQVVLKLVMFFVDLT